MAEAEIVLEQASPDDSVVAIVENNCGSIQFYLHFLKLSEGAGVRQCWVRNLLPSPLELDVDGMEEGNPPLLPAAFCKHPRGAPAPRPDDLSVVWFEEGDGAALLEGSEILAVIPPWSGRGGFDGYARDCTGETPICWSLADDNVIRERVRIAAEYWTSWDDPEYWKRFRDGLVGPVERAVGKSSDKYYAIDGGNWPPKAMLRFDLPDRKLLVTAGVSIRPMPQVEMYVEDPTLHRRIELASAVDARCPDEELNNLAKYISGQTTYPWSVVSWLGEGHTIPCDSVPKYLGGSMFDSMLLTTSPSGAPKFSVPEFRGDRINVLWMVPITSRERQFAVDNTSGPALLEKLAAAGHGVVHRIRRSVV